MGDVIDHLLACIGEECGEVQQVVGKSQRFGLHDVNKKLSSTNLALLVKETHDIISVYQMLCAELGISIEIDEDMLKAKKLRVLKYMEYAKEVGQLS